MSVRLALVTDGQWLHQPSLIIRIVWMLNCLREDALPVRETREI